MTTIDISELGKSSLSVGRFKIKPWGDVEGQDQVYVEAEDCQGGTFPKKDIEQILRGAEPAKAFRKYYRENF